MSNRNIHNIHNESIPHTSHRSHKSHRSHNVYTQEFKDKSLDFVQAHLDIQEISSIKKAELKEDEDFVDRELAMFKNSMKTPNTIKYIHDLNSGMYIICKPSASYSSISEEWIQSIEPDVHAFQRTRQHTWRSIPNAIQEIVEFVQKKRNLDKYTMSITDKKPKKTKSLKCVKIVPNTEDLNRRVRLLIQRHTQLQSMKQDIAKKRKLIEDRKQQHMQAIEREFRQKHYTSIPMPIPRKFSSELASVVSITGSDFLAKRHERVVRRHLEYVKQKPRTTIVKKFRVGVKAMKTKFTSFCAGQRPQSIRVKILLRRLFDELKRESDKKIQQRVLEAKRNPTYKLRVVKRTKRT